VADADHRPLTEWAVLCLLGEGRTHGFEVARVLSESGDLGRVWTVPRPLVYRAIDTLIADGLVVEDGEVPGRGPRRRLVRVTPAGRNAARRWLEQPVRHVREVRTELLLKLGLLHRAGRSPARLLARQRDALAPTVASLRAAPGADGFDAVLAHWRRVSAEAVEAFLDVLTTP
jgi:PadR family transcriptional regulator AphA